MCSKKQGRRVGGLGELDSPTLVGPSFLTGSTREEVEQTEVTDDVRSPSDWAGREG